MLYSIAFLAVILVIGCGVLGGLYLVCRHGRPHEEKPAKKLPMSNLPYLAHPICLGPWLRTIENAQKLFHLSTDGSV